MSDIVERLRVPRMPEDERLWTERKEAADEIERLQAENRFLFDIIKNDALFVERYNAFNERRALAEVRKE